MSIKFLHHVAILILVYLIAVEGAEWYDDNDKVVVLNPANLNSTISNGETAWFVQFYASWCGISRAFATEWKALAESMIEWNDIVKVAAVKCSIEYRHDMCPEYRTTGYPTLRYFSARDQGIGAEVVRYVQEEGTREQLIENLRKDQEDGKGGKHWPNLQPYSSPDSVEWNNSLTPPMKYHFFIFEDYFSLLGSEVILDLHKSKDFQIRRVTRENQQLLRKYRIPRFPSVVALDKDNRHVRLTLQNSTRHGVITAINDFMNSEDPFSKPEEPTSSEAVSTVSEGLPPGVQIVQTNSGDPFSRTITFSGTLPADLNTDIPGGVEEAARKYMEEFARQQMTKMMNDSIKSQQG